MSNKELIESIIDLYEQARHINLPKGIENSKIRRGRSRIVAGYAEELFAHFVSQKIKNIDKILVDQPISYRLGGKARTIYPDILPISNNDIKIIIDLKMDLGMKRDQIQNIYRGASNLLDELRGKDIWYKDGITKEMYTAKITQNAIYLVVVISKLNITKKDLDKQVSLLGSLSNDDKVRLYFLTDVAHPNWQDCKAAKEMIVLLPDFERFGNDLQRHI